MNAWKWSTGEPYYKSARPESKRQEQLSQDNNEYDSQQNAINQSLAEDSFFNQDNDMLTITNSMFSRNQSNIGSKREDIDTKIAGREMISQRGVNPFLQTSYVNDIVTRDMFLKPINTSQEKSKESSQEEQ
jgi:predicted 2-oxoglutarate/Fe(II)-dependent dioxygenase YbiX